MGKMAIGAFAVVFLVVFAVSGTWVSAENHHVVGDEHGWGPSLDVPSWLSGRVFRVGDKIWFKSAESEDVIVELEGLKEFLSCNLTNPIRMYTDRESPVALEKEGVRYFTSGNLESCKKGLKLPVPVQPYAESEPEFDPLWPGPPPPAPDHKYPPYQPIHPPPSEPPPTPPSAAADLKALSFVLFAGLLVCYVGF